MGFLKRFFKGLFGMNGILGVGGAGVASIAQLTEALPDGKAKTAVTMVGLTAAFLSQSAKILNKGQTLGPLPEQKTPTDRPR